MKFASPVLTSLIVILTGYLPCGKTCTGKSSIHGLTFRLPSPMIPTLYLALSSLRSIKMLIALRTSQVTAPGRQSILATHTQNCNSGWASTRLMATLTSRNTGNCSKQTLRYFTALYGQGSSDSLFEGKPSLASHRCRF